MGSGIGLPADRDLALGHHLQQRGLHLGRGAVDLVGEQEVHHHGTEFDIEFLAALTVDPGPDDIGGNQVRSELDTREGTAHDLGERLDGQRLGHTGNTLEQYMPLGKKTHQDSLHKLVLTDDNSLDLEDRSFQGVHIGGQTVTDGRRRGGSARCRCGRRVLRSTHLVTSSSSSTAVGRHRGSVVPLEQLFQAFRIPSTWVVRWRVGDPTTGIVRSR